MVVSLTRSQKRALEILRAHPGIMARDFGCRMWPESASKSSNVGYGSTTGVGVGLKASGWLKQLAKKGLVRVRWSADGYTEHYYAVTQ